MKYKVIHEWLVESVDQHGDIIDSNCYPTLTDAISTTLDCPEGMDYYRIGLVRDEGNDDAGLVDRQWAYILNDGTLEDEYSKGAIIPEKFRAEFAKFDPAVISKYADRDLVESNS
jgi:hypothetical protein